MVTLIDHVLQDFNIMNKKDIHKLIKESINEALYENFNLTNDVGKDDYVDDEGRFAKSQLYKMGKYAVKLHHMLNDMEQLPAWVQSKLTKASDYMSMIYHYLDYEFARRENEVDEMRGGHEHDGYGAGHEGGKNSISGLPGVMEGDALIDSGIEAYKKIIRISPNNSLKGAYARELKTILGNNDRKGFEFEDIKVDDKGNPIDLSSEQAIALTRVAKDVRAPFTIEDNPEMYEGENVIATLASGDTEFIKDMDPKSFDDLKGDQNVKAAKTTKGLTIKEDKIKEYIMNEVSALLEKSYEAPEEILNTLKKDLKMNPLIRYVEYLKAVDTIPQGYEIFLRNGRSFFIIYEEFSLKVKIETKEYFLGNNNEKIEARNHLNNLLTKPIFDPKGGEEGEEQSTEEPAEEPAEEPEA